MKKVNVVLPENLRDKVVAINVLAESIAAISTGIKEIRKGPLKEEALIILIQQNARINSRGRKVKADISTRTIKSVLDSMDTLAEQYIK